MAIGDIPNWIRGPDTLGATSSGASAGLGVARIQQEQQSDAVRQGMEAMRLRQASQLEQARLAQAAEHNQMEFQARQKLNQQMQLRADQRLNIQNAYKTATLGLQQGRLEQVEQAATEKARSAALQFQREQGFARDVAAGMPVMEAYQRNPVSASVLNAVSRSVTGSGENKPIHVGGNIVERKADGTYEVKYRSPTSDKPIKVGKSLIRLDANGNPEVIYNGEPPPSDLLGAVAAPPAQPPGLWSRLKNVVSPSAPTPQPTTKTNAPKVGEVYSGHKYTGGDPTDENNWEEVGE